MVSGPVNYAKTYFIHPTLSTVHGKSTYSSLKILKQELNANASRVTLDLGWGSHRYLRPVLTPAEYLTISVIPYLHPVHPGILTIILGTTQHEVTRLTLEHAMAVRICRESLKLEKVLINIACNALDNTYYMERINPQKNTVIEKNSNFCHGFFILTVTSISILLQKKLRKFWNFPTTFKIP